MTATNGQHLFEKWCAELKFRDKKFESVGLNFSLLFSELLDNAVPFEEAHAILKKAIEKHYPPASTIRHQYRLGRIKGKTEKEFEEDWKDGIASVATKTFYDFFPLAGATEEDKKFIVDHIVVEKDGEMVRKDYIEQQAYVNSFPLLTPEQAEQRINDNIEELEAKVREILGKMDDERQD